MPRSHKSRESTGVDRSTVAKAGSGGQGQRGPMIGILVVGVIVLLVIAFYTIGATVNTDDDGGGGGDGGIELDGPELPQAPGVD
jgi:hypothetical protein